MENNMKNKAKFKWNNGKLALLCSNCATIIKTGKDFTQDEFEAIKGNKDLESQYCEKCKKDRNGK